ncbi:MAG: hypothetical protein ABSA44_11875 [Bacteroidota bacterium]|jgi:hypothetical protein
MRKIAGTALALCWYAMSLFAQVEYKQNFLLALSKQPDIKNCEAAYTFLCCKNNICAVFDTTKATLTKAQEELSAIQLATSNAAMSPATSTMNAEDAKKLSEKLDKMTEEEKQQWAMQNAQNYMPSATAHVNKDIDNQPVTEAVKYVTDQQAKDLKSMNMTADYTVQFNTVEQKYKPKIEEALKKFQTVTRTTDSPSSPDPYFLGEMSDEEAARYNKAVEEYKKTVLPIYNSEMNEKLNCVMQAEQGLVSTYTLVEEKLASTDYSDDAQEPVNKLHLIMAHLSVLQKVKTDIDIFAEVLSQYADQYAALMKKPSVKEVNIKKD